MSHQIFYPNRWQLSVTLSTLLVIYSAGQFVWSNSLGSFADDSVSYLLMAQCWSPYYQPSALIIEACQYERYPPLFPGLLAVTGLAHSIPFAHGFIALCFAAVVVLTFILANAYYQKPALAYSASLLVALMPASWINVLSILSENLYLGLSLLILYLTHRIQNTTSPSARNRLLLAFGLLLSALLLTRTIGISLSAAVFASITLRRWQPTDRPLAYITVLATGLASIWYVMHSPGGEISYHQDLRTQLQALLTGKTSLWPLLAPQIENGTQAWFSNFLIYWYHETDLNFLLTAGFGGLALLGLGLRLRQHQIDAWYVVWYGLILVVWPYPGQIPRFLYAIVPVMVIHAGYALLTLNQRWPRYPLAMTVMAMMLVTTALATGFIYQRAQYDNDNPAHTLAFTHNPDFYRYADLATAERIGLLHASLFTDMQRLQQTTPESARIAWFTRSYLPYLAHRSMVPLPATPSAADFRNELLRLRPDFIFLSHLHPRDTRPQTNGLHGYPAVQPFTTVVWQSQAADHTALSLLLQIDYASLERLAQQPP